jgi:hypothetical protein
MLDLSVISRAYNVKFIVLAKPNRVNKTGIVCMNTTQTNSDNIILLYLQGLTDFSIIKNVSQSPEQALFQLTDLPEVLQREWAATCVNDNLSKLDAVNKLFQAAPVPAKSALTGHTVYVSKEGKVLPNPNIPQVTIKPKLLVKPKPKAPEPVEVAEEPAVAPVEVAEEPAVAPAAEEPAVAPAEAAEEPAVAPAAEESAVAPFEVAEEPAPAPPGRKKLAIQAKRHDALEEAPPPVASPPDTPKVKSIKKLTIRPKITPIEIRSAAPDAPEPQATKIPLKVNIKVKAVAPKSGEK